MTRLNPQDTPNVDHDHIHPKDHATGTELKAWHNHRQNN